MLYETYERKGLPLPDGERKWRMCGEARLKGILSSNERIQAAYVFREMLQSALACRDPKVMELSLEKFVSVVKASGIPELEKVWRMLERRMGGIVTHAVFQISNGPVEGTNNMIKTLRRHRPTASGIQGISSSRSGSGAEGAPSAETTHPHKNVLEPKK